MTVLINATAPAVGAYPSVKYNDLGSLWRDSGRTAFASGTFGGAIVTLQMSPDPASTADASSRWYTVATFSAPGSMDFSSKFKKMRANVTTTGTGTVEVEVI